jgi:hypothetical protein
VFLTDFATIVEQRAMRIDLHENRTTDEGNNKVLQTDCQMLYCPMPCWLVFHFYLEHVEMAMIINVKYIILLCILIKFTMEGCIQLVYTGFKSLGQNYLLLWHLRSIGICTLEITCF